MHVVLEEIGIDRLTVVVVVVVVVNDDDDDEVRPQILKTWDQSFATVLFKHYVSTLQNVHAPGRMRT